MEESSHADRTRASTLTDVARLAGVSVATASKALNGKDQVKAQTRQRVMLAAEQLAFSPNALARGLLAGRTGTVGLLTSDLEGRFSIPILMGAEDAFGAGQISILLCDARGDTIREQHHLRALLGRRVDGLIVVGARPDVRRPLPGNVPVPVVYAYAASDSAADTSVVTDNVSAGQRAVEHLISCGKQRIAHITGDPNYSAAHDRAAGAAAALATAGLEMAGGQPEFGSWSAAWGRTSASALMRRHPDIDGIFCGSDQIAIGVLDALRDLSLQVPKDVAVIGFDNWSALAASTRPQLSSIDMRLEALGTRAAQLLFAAMDGTPTPGTEKITSSVVIRESTVGSN